MKISSFRLKFQVSEITKFSAPIIVVKILAKLQDKKYDILDVTDNNITFERDPIRLLWNFQAPFILDGGDFKITKSEQGAIVILNYFINTWYLLPIIAFVIFFIFQGEYFATLFFGLFYLAAGVFQYTTTKNVGKELLRDILTDDY